MVNCVSIIWQLIREAIIISLIQHFEADFLWKVSLKILNWGLILKTFMQDTPALSFHREDWRKWTEEWHRWLKVLEQMMNSAQMADPSSGRHKCAGEEFRSFSFLRVLTHLWSWKTTKQGSLNPLYPHGFFLLDGCNKLGMVHCIYWGL